MISHNLCALGLTPYRGVTVLLLYIPHGVFRKGYAEPVICLFNLSGIQGDVLSTES